MVPEAPPPADGWLERLAVACATHPARAALGALAAVLCGLWGLAGLRLDAIPDLSDPQVVLTAAAPGRAPDLVDAQVTGPLVSALTGTPGVKAVRGYSMAGDAFVYVVFDESTDPWWARSRVAEALGPLAARLPAGSAPVLGPPASGVGWIYQYALVDPTGQTPIDRLRALQEFTLRDLLQSTPGVAEIATVGGAPRVLEVRVDPARLQAQGLSVDDVVAAARDAGAAGGGRSVPQAGRALVVRTDARVRGPEDLRLAPVGGGPRTLGEVATVVEVPGPRAAVTDLDGRGEVVGGIVVMRHGANPLEVIDAVEARIAAAVRPALPPGVELVPTYDRSRLIRAAVATLRDTLLEEGVVVALVIAVFLLHARSALVAILCLPAAVLVSFAPMRLLGVEANIMSLGGIALAIGEMTDAAIVLVEHAHKRIERDPSADRRALLTGAARELARPLFFSLLVIAVSFLPVFGLEAQEGRLFAPLAWTKTLAMLAAALASVTLAPALLVWFVRGPIRPESANPLNRALVAAYLPVARAATAWPRATVALGLAIGLAAIPPFRALGTEFMPPLDEGDLVAMPTTLPGISPEEAQELLRRQNAVLAAIPEVERVFGKAGRAETATDPAPFSMIETNLTLKPRSEWRPGLDTAGLIAELDRTMRWPGLVNAWVMPVRNRIDMQATGVRTPVGVRVAGPDLRTIERVAAQVAATLQGVPGTRSAFAERTGGGWTLDIAPRRADLARAGVSAAALVNAVEVALGGVTVGTVDDGPARSPIQVRVAPDFRQDAAAIGALPIPVGRSVAAAPGPVAAGGMGGMGGMGAPATAAAPAPAPGPVSGRLATLPLSALADIRVIEGPSMLLNEDGALVGTVYVDTDTTDIAGYVARAQAAVEAAVVRPPGVILRWVGQAESIVRVRERLAVLVPLSLGLVAFFLWMSLRDLRRALLVLLAVPFALVGGVFLLWALDYRTSVATWVGFLALAGVAAETGVVMLVTLDEAVARHAPTTRAALRAAVLDGAALRLRPKVMTTATTILGLLPLLWSSGTGADAMKRITAPLVGGLASSAALVLIGLPALYLLMEGRRLPASSSAD